MTTSTPLDTLTDYVTRSTTVYRKGDVVEFKTSGHIDVVIIDAFPALPEGLKTTIDCHFISIGITEAITELSHEAFYDLVASSHQGIFGEIHAPDWAEGLSYIAIGAWLGDQTLAFRFMACAQAHGLGKVITPATLGITGQQGDDFAGAGYVMLSTLVDPRTPVAPAEVSG